MRSKVLLAVVGASLLSCGPANEGVEASKSASAAQKPAPLQTPAARGHFGEWVKGNSMEVRMNVVTRDGVELPQIDFKNHSDYGISILPCYARVKYQDGKVLEATEKCEDSAIKVEPRSSLTEFATIRFKENGPQASRLLSVEIEVGGEPKLGRERFVFHAAGETK